MPAITAWRAVGTCCLALALPVAASAQTVDNLLLVENDRSPASLQVGDYYARARHVAADHIVHLAVPVADAISRPAYDQTIEKPVASWVEAHSLQDRILYLVLTKGIPLRIEGTGGRDGTTASVDSELTLLYTRLLGERPPIGGHVPNPYFLADAPVSTAKHFSRVTAETYLVTRLDGFTVDDVTKLIDRGLNPSREGPIVLDQKATILDRGGDQWLQATAARVEQAFGPGHAILDTASAPTHPSAPVLGYYSWGSNDPAIRSRRVGLTFSNGAVGATYVSTDGRTFNEPPAAWMFSDPNGRGPSFGGTFQSLAGDLIRDGITGLAANVAEPYLDAIARPQVLFPAYLAGFNLAEAFYLSLPYLSWEEIVIGDPLCAPFRTSGVAPTDLDRGLDPETELPTLFSARRLALVSHGGLNTGALKLALKADARVATGHRTDAEALLVRAVDLEPRLSSANLTLAASYEEAGDAAKAADRYRKVLAVDPQNVVALNNLAFNLADKQHAPADALPFADRAYQLSRDPVVVDTLGWVHHLMGDNAAAAPLLETAAAPGDNAEILLHAAVVQQALGNAIRARRELDGALQLDAAFGKRPDVAALAAALTAAAPPTAGSASGR